ncbi:MAG: 3'-5' exoribonuclease [Flavobacterium sp.]|nr:3'-5' exoribonuclease [Flavobacterium sp.]
MKNNFVAIDFETSYGHIPCSIGIVEFNEGKIINEYYSLIKPIGLKFSNKNSSIHFIEIEDVINEREFDEIWDEIEHFFLDRVVVSHNSSFDISVLGKTLKYYGIVKPEFKSFCTLNISRLTIKLDNYKLSTIAKHFEIEQNDYHNALEDAAVCGQIFYKLYDQYNIVKANNESSNIKSSNNGINYRTYLNRIYSDNNLKDKFQWSNSEKLSGKTLVVSGVFEQFSRDDLKKAIEDNGGKVGSSISAKTDYVVAGENMGPAKLEKANQLKIPIITEDDFLKMLSN